MESHQYGSYGQHKQCLYLRGNRIGVGSTSWVSEMRGLLTRGRNLTWPKKATIE